jgi:hypothetical protein
MGYTKELVDFSEEEIRQLKSGKSGLLITGIVCIIVILLMYFLKVSGAVFFTVTILCGFLILFSGYKIFAIQKDLQLNQKLVIKGIVTSKKITRNKSRFDSNSIYQIDDVTVRPGLKFDNAKPGDEVEIHKGKYSDLLFGFRNIKSN